MLSRSLIKRMTFEERNHLRDGGAILGFLTGGLAYYNYRLWVQKDFLRSEGHYRLNQKINNMTPFKSLYFTWWRMPDEEFNVYHRFRPYYIIGQIDYAKEILIPKKKLIDGELQDGYDVINPVYCYEGGRFSLIRAVNKEDPVLIERAAFIMNRGWIPEYLKDKKSRPNEINTRKLHKFRGVFRKGKNLHDYKIPNNPENNEWHNLALEDIGLYWELPNYDEIKHYYFQMMELPQHPASDEEHNHLFPLPLTGDELIEDHYGWKVKQSTNHKAYLGLGALSDASFVVGLLA